jgi:hypothetical protein
MAVQDDIREQELCNLFNLEWDPDHARGGDDAWFETKIQGETRRVPVEVKSTTSDSVSTARDVGLPHIEKWRQKLWVIGFYTKSHGRPRLQDCLCLTPEEMEPWIAQIEAYIAPDIKLSELASRHLALDDLYTMCGEKRAYTLDDARTLYKRQLSLEEYKAAMDIDDGYSPGKMLEILRSRLRYIADRGATLNNPHVTKKFLASFDDQRISKNHAEAIRTKFNDYAASQRGEQSHGAQRLTRPEFE